MSYLRLPNLRTVLEALPLHNLKLEKILAEGQSRVASFLDVRYPDGQDIVFLLGGKPVKAGRISAAGREILTVSEALEKMRLHQDGVLNFYEISKLLMIVVMGTFIFEPTHGRLKVKLINFSQLLALFARKRFTGYLELKLDNGLNYLTFFKGQPREGYFTAEATPEQAEFPVRRVEQLLETAGENDEINVYESVGEEGLHETTPEPEETAEAAPEGEPVMGLEDGRAEFTAEILDLCMAAIYEDLFRLMMAACTRQLTAEKAEAMFAEALDQATFKYPGIFQGVREREDGAPAGGGLINFERLLKAKKTFPAAERDQEFMTALNELAQAWLRAMRRALSKAVFEQGLKSLSEKIASSRKAYQGNFTIIKFLYDFSRLLERVYSE
jgi:hypothetical protein